MGDAHAPARLQTYLDTHEAHMQARRERGFIHEDTLTWEAASGYLRLHGEIACSGNIVIEVRKHLAQLPGELVETFGYAYCAFVRGHGTFLRVDNAHAHPGHEDEHHRHRCDWRDAKEKELPGSPEWIGRRGWPTLGAFIDEVEAWYHEHRDELPAPDEVPELGLRRRVDD